MLTNMLYKFANYFSWDQTVSARQTVSCLVDIIFSQDFFCCHRSQHLQEVITELLEISEQLLDETADPSQVPSLQARRKSLTAIKKALQSEQGQGVHCLSFIGVSQSLGWLLAYSLQEFPTFSILTSVLSGAEDHFMTVVLSKAGSWSAADLQEDSILIAM